MKTIFAAASLLLCASFVQGFLPAPPTITATPGASSSSVVAHDATPTALNAVLNGGDPVNGDKPKLKLPNTCDSDYDCDGSEFCCEFMFFKMCCSDGEFALAHICLGSRACVRA